MKTFTVILMLAAAVALVPCSATTIQFLDDPTGTAGPYQLSEDGQPIWGTCYIYAFHVAPPYVWEATEYQVTDFSDPERTALLEAEWLNEQFAVSTDTAGIHQAIWGLFGATFADSDTLQWGKLAQQNYGSVDPGSFYMLIPDAATSIQPFLVTKSDPPASNPEPAPWILLGSALVALGWQKRRTS